MCAVHIARWFVRTRFVLGARRGLCVDPTVFTSEIVLWTGQSTKDRPRSQNGLLVPTIYH